MSDDVMTDDVVTDDFDDAHDPPAVRLARRVVRGLVPVVTHVVLAPGSRSAPLAYALAEAERLGALKVLIRTDERSAAFTALGIGRATNCAAAVVTTSGTAVGNLLPAIMEADMGGDPLVAVTADRPERLHGTGANQTTWQRGMFAGRVRDELHLEQSEVGEPGAAAGLGARSGRGARSAGRAPGSAGRAPGDVDRDVATRVQRLVRAGAGPASRQSASGPVHLNIGFDEPLVPADTPHAAEDSPRQWISAGDDGRRASEQNSGGQDPGRRSTSEASGQRCAGESPPPASAHLREGLWPRRTLFVAGDRAPQGMVGVIRALGQPLAAEPTSGLRRSDLASVPGYRLILQSAQAGQDAQSPRGSAWGMLTEQVEWVVVLGRPTLSRPVQRLLARPGVETVQYAPAAEPWCTPERVGRPVLSELGDLLDFAGVAPEGWTDSWQQAGQAAQHLIDAELAALPRLSSVRAAQYVAETAATPLLLGSSSVIRDVDLAAGFAERSSRPDALDGGPDRNSVFAMRGLAGIDGNLSAASGLALASGRRVTALVGDLTFLHDLNALLIPTTEEVPALDAVVVNDQGGAIFDQLEHGAVARRPGEADVVERLFGTPQSADIASLARGYGHEHVLTESTEELGAALADPAGRSGIRVVEVRTDRSIVRDFHARLAARARQ